MHTDVVIIRLVFTGILVASGYVLKPIDGIAWISAEWISAVAGAVIAVCIIIFERRIRRASLKTLIGAFLIGFLISHQSAGDPNVKTFATLALTFFMAYVGLMVGAAKGDYLELS